MYSRMTAHIKSRKAFFCTCATSFLPRTAGKEKRVWPPKVTASISIISCAVETCQRAALRGGFLLRFWCFKREKVSVWELSDVRVLQSQNTDCRKDRPGCVLNRSRVFGVFRAKKVLPLFSASRRKNRLLHQISLPVKTGKGISASLLTHALHHVHWC